MAKGSTLHEVGGAMCRSGSSGTTPERALSDCGPTLSDEEDSAETTFRYKYMHVHVYICTYAEIKFWGDSAPPY